MSGEKVQEQESLFVTKKALYRLKVNQVWGGWENKLTMEKKQNKKKRKERREKKREPRET